MNGSRPMPDLHAWYRSQPSAAEIARRLDGHASWIELDLDHLSFDLARIRERVGAEVEVMPVVKNDIALNHALLDLTGTDAAAGDVVEVFAHEGENSLRAMARAAGWMVYSLMNHLSPDIPRVCRRGEVPVALREPGTGDLHGADP